MSVTHNICIYSSYYSTAAKSILANFLDSTLSYQIYPKLWCQINLREKMIYICYTLSQKKFNHSTYSV